MVARGPHLSEMKRNGLTLLEQDLNPRRMKIKVAQDPSELGTQDFVFVTLKAHSVPYVAESMAPLFRGYYNCKWRKWCSVVVFLQSWR